ncbi:MAG: hypothetical protein ACREJ4_04505 [Candidatus Methylomirabilaceae bacterium]
MASTALAHVDNTGMDRGLDRPRRRSFTDGYKLQILAEYDATTEAGARGALLRREGLYSSHIVEWRRARDAGVLGSDGRAGGRRRQPEGSRELKRLRRHNAALERELAKTQTALEIMGKAHALLEQLSESADAEPTSKRSSRRRSRS